MYRFTSDPPDVMDFCTLRNACGWDQIDSSLGRGVIKNSLCWACYYQDVELVAMGRVIGDNALNYYIQDVIVAEAYRRQGLAQRVMDMLLHWVRVNADPRATLGLMSVSGLEDFYSQFGFQNRPQDVFGAGMTLTVGDL